jgi:hypothetical protein
MTVVSEITADDVIAFNLYHLEHAPAMRRYVTWTRLGAAGVAAITVWSLVAYLAYDSRSIPALILAITAGILAYRLTPALMLLAAPGNVQRMLRDSRFRGMIGRQELALTPDVIVFRADSGERRISWHAVERIADTHAHIFIYDTPITALIIPSRSFATRADRDAFLDQARSLLPSPESLLPADARR